MNKEKTSHECTDEQMDKIPAGNRDEVEKPHWCWACQRFTSRQEISLNGLGDRHDEDKGGCGCYIR
jgi:hypothetical protein